MFVDVYGICSGLIPLFLLVAAIQCFTTNWSVKRGIILLGSIVPFFTLDAIEHVCRMIIDANTGEFVPGGVKEQLHQVFKNLGYILEEAGYSFKDVVKTTVYLADMGDFATLNEVYAMYFSEPYPARVAYQVAALPKAARVEIDVIAVK